MHSAPSSPEIARRLAEPLHLAPALGLVLALRSTALLQPAAALRVAALVLLAALIAGAPTARATDADNDAVATLKWRHENSSNISKFRVFSRMVRDDSRTESWVDVGLPGANGVYKWSFDVPEGGEIWVAVSAIDLYGLESDRTPWRHFVWNPAEARLHVPGRARLVE